MHRDAGHSLDGIKLVRLPVKTVACKCVALLCCYHAAFHYSRALNSYAVQSISKVSFLFCFAFCVPFRWVGRWINKTWAGHNFFSSTIHRWVIDFSTFRGSNSKKKTEIPSSVWQSHFGMRARITHVDVNLLLPGQNTITHRTFRCTAWKGRKNCHEGKQRKKSWIYSLIFQMLFSVRMKFIVMKICALEYHLFPTPARSPHTMTHSHTDPENGESSIWRWY